jgi:hypothetical protein
VIVTLSCGLPCAGLPCECVVEHFGDEALFGFGELGDGFKLSFKFGDGPFACAARGCGGEARKKEMEEQIADLVCEWSLGPMVTALQALKGLGPVI